MNDKIIRTTDPIIIQKTENRMRIIEREEAHKKLREAVDQINQEYRLQTAKFRKKWITVYRPEKTRAHQIMSNGLWSGYRCFIIGGGTSIQNFDFKLLRGEKIIAINRAYEICPFADIMFSMDSRYYQWVTKGELGEEALKKFNQFKGIKIFVDTVDFPYKNVITIEAVDRLGLSWDLRRGIFHGNNSGYSALQFAIALRASPIYLLGYDFYHRGAKSHWHSGYPNKITEDITKSHMRDFKFIAEDLTISQNKISIINLNPESSLTCFPRMSHEEIKYHGTNHRH